MSGDLEGRVTSRHTAALWRLTGLVTALACVAAAAVASASWSLGPPALLLAFIAATSFAGALPFVVAVRGDEGEEISADEALLVVMLATLPPLGVLVGFLLGNAIVHTIRRREAVKVTYNHAAQAISVSAAIGVYAVLAGDASTRSAQGLVAAALAASVYSAMAAALVRLVVAVALRTPIRSAMGDGAGVNFVASALVVGWGVLVLGSTRNDAAAAALVAVPMTGSWLLRRSERQRTSMAGLLDAAVAVGGAIRHGAVSAALAEAADHVLGRTGGQVVDTEPGPLDVAAPMATPRGTRWLVAGAQQSWDRPRREDQVLIGALAAIGGIALENAALLDAAGRDPDTGLPTGALLQARLQDLIDHHRHVGAALLVVRIPRFEVVQRTLGPAAGRRELNEVSSRLRLLGEELRQTTADQPGSDGRDSASVVIGYLGGGDFALAVPAAATAEQALGTARIVQRQMLRPVAVDGVELAIEPAIGVRLVPPMHAGTATAAHLLRDAVSAAASAGHRAGRHRIELVESAPGGDDSALLEVEAELRTAITRGQLTVLYQPVVSISTGRITGAEALVRWSHPERGMIGPQEFVPIAEGSSLIVDLDRYVLRRAVAQLSAWADEGLPAGFTVAVNLSALHLAEPDTAAFVVRLLDAAGLEGGRLTVEVTESSVMTEASSALATLEALAERGVDIALDDFGTGYSSLLYLRDFPVGKLKIDRSFVSRMTESGGDAAIVTTVVRLAQTLGLATVAEGVETDEQHAALLALGCDAGQGFLWDAALDPDRFRSSWLNVRDCEPRHDGRAALSPDASWEVPTIRDDELAYVVHELRSPLAAIDGFAHLAALDISRLEDAGDLPDHLVRIRRGVQTLLEIIETLHDSSAANLGGMTLELRPVEVSAFVEATVAAVAPALGVHRVRVHTGDPVHASIDETRIAQVLRNLLTNAAKFSDPGSPIDVLVSGGRDCTIAVRDHGAGVPVERRSELFRRFARLGSDVKGMGLGLHLARTIARRHGGDVTYDAPADGTGSIFSLHLPAIPAPPDPGAATPTA